MNPVLSFIWQHPALVALSKLPGVAFVLVYYSAYGTLYIKPTLFLHNTPCLHELYRPQPLGPGQSVELRGWVRIDVEKFPKTLLAQAYPPALTNAYSLLLANSLALRRAALEANDPVPMADAAEDCTPAPFSFLIHTEDCTRMTLHSSLAALELSRAYTLWNTLNGLAISPTPPTISITAPPKT